MAWSTPDLTDITQVLRGLVQTAVNNSGLSLGNIQIYCDSPETVRQTDGNCHLTIYLLHVGRDPYWRNTPVQGPRAQLNNAQPLSLNLSYLLTAWSDKDFATEQLAMTIALQAIHSQPIVTQNVIQNDALSQWLPNGEFVMSIEADTIDEMSRLWQAFTVPMRLSALIRVGVVFVAPLAPIVPPAIPPSTAVLSVAPDHIAPATAPLLTAGFAQEAPPLPPGADPATVSYSIGPLVVVAGGALAVAGNGLDSASLAADVFLSIPGTATEWMLDPSWRQGASPGELDLLFPEAYALPTGSPLTATPLPGLYNLAVGGGTTRSNTVPVAVAPSLSNVPNPPLLTPDASGVYSFTGAGFSQSIATAVNFGTNGLTYTTVTPAPGEFTVNSTGTLISFVPPPVPAGAYPVMVTVNQIAATTGWVVQLTLLVPDASGFYEIAGTGFAPASSVAVLFDTSLLVFTAGTPTAGEFAVNSTGTLVTFLPPPAPPGYHSVLVAVAGVAVSTGWLVQL